MFRLLSVLEVTQRVPPTCTRFHAPLANFVLGFHEGVVDDRHHHRQDQRGTDKQKHKQHQRPKVTVGNVHVVVPSTGVPRKQRQDQSTQGNGKTFEIKAGGDQNGVSGVRVPLMVSRRTATVSNKEQQ